MSKEINDIVKEISKSHKELYQADSKLNKEMSDLSKDIDSLKKEVKIISAKIDSILELLNSLMVFIEDAGEEMDEEELESYDSNEGWVNNYDEASDLYDSAWEDEDDVENG